MKKSRNTPSCFYAGKLLPPLISRESALSGPEAVLEEQGHSQMPIGVLYLDIAAVALVQIEKAVVVAEVHAYHIRDVGSESESE